MRIMPIVAVAAMLSTLWLGHAAAYSPASEQDRLANAVRKTSADFIGKQPLVLPSIELPATTGNAIDAVECYEVPIRYRRSDGRLIPRVVNWCQAE